jgi:hypothetical protein
MVTKVTIDLDFLDLELDLGGDYRIAMDQDFVTEVGNNRSPSPLISNILTFKNATYWYGIAPLSSTVSINASAGTIKKTAVPLSSAASLNIDGIKVTYLENVATTYTYISNSVNDIFGVGTTPQLGDTIDGTFTVTLSTANGDFASTTDPLNGESTLEYTGNKAQVNAWLDTIRFYPDKNYTSNTTFTITLVKAGTGGYTITKTPALNFAGASGFTPRTYTLSTDGSWTPQFDELKYGVMDYAIIGAGGSGSGCYGGTSTIYSPCGGSGGGAGRVITATNQSIPNVTATYTIGQGGASVTGFTSGNTGSSTIIVGWGGTGGAIIAGGGGGGIAGGYTVSPPTNGKGGDSGATTLGGPMRFLTSTFKTTGGGGGGAGGNAPGAGTSQSIPSGDGLGAAGGVGVSFLGTTYGVGGNGWGPTGSTTTAPTTYGSGGQGQNNLGSFNVSGKNGAIIIYIHD